MLCVHPVLVPRVHKYGTEKVYLLCTKARFGSCPDRRVHRDGWIDVV